MIPFIKNKFRFVTVSLLLTSLVTIVSSASAESEELGFSFEIPVCTVPDEPPVWSPTIDPTTDGLTVERGTTRNTVTVLTRFENGYSECAGGSLDVNGTVLMDIVIAGGESWVTDTDCGLGYCMASDSLVSLSGYFDVPSNATRTTYSGTLTLTWNQG